MVIHTQSTVDYSTFPAEDGEPMAETFAHAVQMIDLQFALRRHLEAQRRTPVAVGGNQLMYYDPTDGHKHLSPDVYVVFGREGPPPPKWETWIEGKFPDLVFEVSSPSTQQDDLSVGPRGKRRRYAELGVQEYYVFDPLGEVQPPFQGFVLRGGRLEPCPPVESGGIWSALLGAELRPVALPASADRPAGVYLRVIDPQSGVPVPVADEVFRAAQLQGQARQEAEARAAQEAGARQEAEARAAQAEARVQILLEQIAAQERER